MDLFGEPVDNEPKPTLAQDDTLWAAGLAQRLKTLLLTSPIHRIHAAKSQFSEDLTAIDVRAIALRVLDTAIECMGFGDGATRPVMVQAIEPIARRSEPGASADRIRSIADRILDAMLNDREQRSEFEEPYIDLLDETPVWRAFTFRLIREEELPDGSIVIRATTQGINLYLGMLEFDVQNAQIASEAVLHEQIRRGHVEKAVAAAQQARLRSIQFEEELRETLRSLQRDISNVDWTGRVLPKLEEARDHIQQRLATEGELIDIVSQRQDEASEEDVVHLAMLLDAIRDCQQRHLRLNERLIPANAAFLDEQARQGFRTVVHTQLADMEAEIVLPALAAPAGELASRVDEMLFPFHAAYPAAPLDLAQLTSRLLAPRRESAEVTYEFPEADLEEIALPEPPFCDDDYAAVDRLLAEHVPSQGVPLSALLKTIREQDIGCTLEDCLVMTVMQAYDSQVAVFGPAGVSAIRAEPAGQPLCDRRYVGDELFVTQGDRK